MSNNKFNGGKFGGTHTTAAGSFIVKVIKALQGRPEVSKVVIGFIKKNNSGAKTKKAKITKENGGFRVHLVDKMYSQDIHVSSTLSEEDFQEIVDDMVSQIERFGKYKA